MNKNSDRVQIKTERQQLSRQKREKKKMQEKKKNDENKNNPLNCSNNKQLLQFNDIQTKQSSRISNNSLFQFSCDFSEISFEKQQLLAQDFFKQELILERKINKKQLIFRHQCFTNQFISFITDLLFKFSQQPTNHNFQSLLQQIKTSNIQIFNYQQIKNMTHHPKLTNFKQVMESLIFERKHWFFIYTFDLLVCHLTFFIVLMVYWVQHQKNTENKMIQIGNQKNRRFDYGDIDLKHNIISIVKAYIRSHPQQINENQALFLLVLFFIDTLKQSSAPSQRDGLFHIQRELVNDIIILRKIQKKQRSCFKFNQDHNIQSKIYQYQQSHGFIAKPQLSYEMIRSHVFENSCSEIITKFYHLDPEIRKNYQLRKDAFCLWVLQSIIKEGENKSGSVHRNAAMYIVQIMGMLKKMKSQNNIEGISYLLPIVANIKILLPKVWRHVIKRRPQIEIKLNQYSDFMLKNKFQIQQLGHDGIIWGQTIFIMTEKIIKFIKSKNGIDLNEHQKFYDLFLSQVFYYRHRAMEIVKDNQFQFTCENEEETGFNLTSLENYLTKKYLKLGFVQCWKELTKKAQRINENMSESVVADIFDYWFIGSVQKYKKVDI